jgi:hypothetical protein
MSISSATTSTVLPRHSNSTNSVSRFVKGPAPGHLRASSLNARTRPGSCPGVIVELCEVSSKRHLLSARIRAAVGIQDPAMLRCRSPYRNPRKWAGRTHEPSTRLSEHIQLSGRMQVQISNGFRVCKFSLNADKLRFRSSKQSEDQT